MGSELWRSNKVIALVNVGQVEVVDFKLPFFSPPEINNHKDGDSAYILDSRKLRDGVPVTVLEKERFLTSMDSERSYELLVIFFFFF